MASNQKRVPKDAGNLPIPGYYNAAADAFEAVQGADGAQRVRQSDGDNVALGSRSDAASSGDLTGSFTCVSLEKEVLTHLRSLDI